MYAGIQCRSQIVEVRDIHGQTDIGVLYIQVCMQVHGADRRLPRGGIHDGYRRMLVSRYVDTQCRLQIAEGRGIHRRI